MNTYLETPEFSVISINWLENIKPYILIDSDKQLEAENHLIGLLVHHLKKANNYYWFGIDGLRANNPDLLDDLAYMTELLDESWEDVNVKVETYLMSGKISFEKHGWKMRSQDVDNLIEFDGHKLDYDPEFAYVEVITRSIQNIVKQVMTHLYQ